MPHAMTQSEIALTIRRGTVYYFLHDDGSPHPHYFVVVNANPQDDKVLLLTLITSKIEKLKERRAANPATVVYVTKADYNELEVPSAVDCFKVHEESKASLLAKVNREFKRHHDDMPPEVMDKIIAAVKASPRVSSEQKKML